MPKTCRQRRSVSRICHELQAVNISRRGEDHTDLRQAVALASYPVAGVAVAVGVVVDGFLCRDSDKLAEMLAKKSLCSLACPLTGAAGV